MQENAGSAEAGTGQQLAERRLALEPQRTGGWGRGQLLVRLQWSSLVASGPEGGGGGGGGGGSEVR